MYRTTASHDADRAALVALAEVGIPEDDEAEPKPVCTTCHGTGRVVGERGGRESWFLCGDCETEPYFEEWD